MIIDHHNHIWVGKPTGEGFLDHAMNVEAILRDMDVAGVEKAGVVTIAQDIQNDYVLQAQTQHSDRLFGYVMVNPREEGAAGELRCFLDAGLKGLKLHPRLHGFPLSSEGMVHPLLAICQEFKVPVFSHGNSNEEFNTSFHFEELAKAFPQVPIIYGHMGSFNEVDNAVKVAARNDNLYLDTSLCSLDDLRTALKGVGPAKILMSTDWPGSDFRLEQFKVELATDGNEEARKSIEGGSYERLVEKLG